MKGCLRTAITGVGLLLIAVALGAILLVVQANTWLRTPAETALSAALGAPCRIAAFHFRPLAYSMEINGLSLSTGTPESGVTLSVDSLQVTPDFRTFFTRTPVLRKSVAKGVRIEVRVGSATDIGLLVLGAWQAHAAAAKAAPSTTTTERWAVKEFTFDGVRLGTADPQDDIVIPKFVIGGPDSPPIPPGDLVRQFLKTVVKRAVETEGKSNPLATVLGAGLGVLSESGKAQ